MSRWCRSCGARPNPPEEPSVNHHNQGEPMRFMVIVKANKESEAGMMPDRQILEEMGRYNEGLAKAGMLLAAEGLHPSSKGKRVRFSGSERTVTDGPFPE